VCKPHHDEKPPPPRGRRTQNTVDGQKSARRSGLLALHGRRPRASARSRSTSTTSPTQRSGPSWPTPALGVNPFAELTYPLWDSRGKGRSFSLGAAKESFAVLLANPGKTTSCSALQGLRKKRIGQFILLF